MFTSKKKQKKEPVGISFKLTNTLDSDEEHIGKLTY